MTESLVKRLRRLDREAAKAPWKQSGPLGIVYEVPSFATVQVGEIAHQFLGGFRVERDTKLIVAMRNALPELLRLHVAAKAQSNPSPELAAAVEALDRVE